MQGWRDTVNDDQQEYFKIFTAVKQFDKQIARRYDGLRGSWFLETLEMQLVETWVIEADLGELSVEVREQLLLWLKRRKQYIEHPDE